MVMDDERAMRRAIELGATVRATAHPNPWVGCVVESVDGHIFEGATLAPGRALTCEGRTWTSNSSTTKGTSTPTGSRGASRSPISSFPTVRSVSSRILANCIRAAPLLRYSKVSSDCSIRAALDPDRSALT